MRSKLKDPGLRRESRVWCVTALYRPAVSGTCPDRCSTNGPLRKSERICPTANPPSPALYAARDRKLIGSVTALYRPAVSGTCPDQCSANGPLRKNERICSTANPPSPAFYAACDRKLIGMLTEGRGVGRVVSRPDFWRKIVKMTVKT